MKQPRHVLPGDHVFTVRRRTLSTYSHHGIYIGEGNVAHFSSQGPDARPGLKSTAQLATIAEFHRDDPVTLRWYKSPKLTSTEAYAGALRRAHEVLTCFADPGAAQAYQYNLFSFNCEHLATYCRTGRVRSEQLSRGARNYRNGMAYAFVNASQAIPGISLAITAIGLSGSYLRHRRERPDESFFQGRGMESINWAKNLFEGYDLEYQDVPALFS